MNDVVLVVWKSVMSVRRGIADRLCFFCSGCVSQFSRLRLRLQAELINPDIESGTNQGDEGEPDAVDRLTGAFMDVRYAHRSPTNESLARLEAEWQALRGRLRRRPRGVGGLTGSPASDAGSAAETDG